jgi:BlaI family penicillinase repressor
VSAVARISSSSKSSASRLAASGAAVQTNQRPWHFSPDTCVRRESGRRQSCWIGQTGREEFENIVCRDNYICSIYIYTNRRLAVVPKLTKLELRIMEALWTHGASSVREIQERFPGKHRPAYTTVQTMVYRLEGKKALRRIKKIGNAHIFDAVISRSAAQRRLIDELLSLFGGRTQPVVAHLIESGKLTIEDVQEAERTLRTLARKDESS